MVKIKPCCLYFIVYVVYLFLFFKIIVILYRKCARALKQCIWSAQWDCVVHVKWNKHKHCKVLGIKAPQYATAPFYVLLCLTWLEPSGITTSPPPSLCPFAVYQLLINTAAVLPLLAGHSSVISNGTFYHACDQSQYNMYISLTDGVWCEDVCRITDRNCKPIHSVYTPATFGAWHRLAD